MSESGGKGRRDEDMGDGAGPGRLRSSEQARRSWGVGTQRLNLNSLKKRTSAAWGGDVCLSGTRGPAPMQPGLPCPSSARGTERAGPLRGRRLCSACAQMRSHRMLFLLISLQTQRLSGNRGSCSPGVQSRVHPDRILVRQR